MDDNYIKISHELLNFKTNLSKEISNTNKIKFNLNNECFLIKEKWFNDFEELISEINSKKKLSKKIKGNVLYQFYSKNKPEFINDINSAIKNLEENSNLKIISKNLVNLLYKKDFILKNNSIRYYAGNNKLIFEFINSNVSNILLRIKPLENLSKQTIYYFTLKNKIEKKLIAFKALIENEISNKIFEAYQIEVKKLNINFQTPNELIQDKSIYVKSSQSFNLIIKLLIALYYYESSLINEDKEKIINYNEKSYLINPEWIDNIKSTYKYQELTNLFNKIQKEFDFSNFNKQIERIYEKCKPNIGIKNITISTDAFKAKDISPKETKENKFYFYEKFYVFPKKIMEIITPLFSKYNKPQLHSIFHFWKNNLLCIRKNNNIYIGEFNNNKEFIPEYILCYKDIENLSTSEFNDLFNSSEIIEFFKKRKCNDSSAYLQKIIGINGNSLGIFIIPNTNDSIINRNIVFDINKNKNNIKNEVNISENNDYKKEIHLNRSIENNKIEINNYLRNSNNKDYIEEPKKDNQKELKEKELLIKQNEELKSQIKMNENEINKINNLNKLLQQELQIEKEKNIKLEEIKKNFEIKLKEKEDNNEKNQIEKIKQQIEIEKKEKQKVMEQNKELIEINKLLNIEEEKMQLELIELKKQVINIRHNNNNIIIEKYENDMNKLREKNKELEKLIDKQKQEINDYIFKLNNLSDTNRAITYKPGDKIISVLFMTQGNNDIFNYSMPCKSTELFIRLEERLYIDFPKYRNVETFFMVNANRILRFKTLEENKIKSNDIISLFTTE